MRKLIRVLLVITTLQLTFDETLSRFDFSGNIDLKGNTATATANSGLQKLHDHLWCFKFRIHPAHLKVHHYKAFISNDTTADPGFSFRIWQPPKC